MVAVRVGENVQFSTFMYPGTQLLEGDPSRLFQIQRGAVGQGFTLALRTTETNLKEPSKVSNRSAYAIRGIAAQVLAGDRAADAAAFEWSATFSNINAAGTATSAPIADLARIVQCGVLNWDFDQTSIQIAPLMLVGAGGGIYGALSTISDAAAPASVTGGAMNNGVGGFLRYSKPVLLPQGQQFAIEINYGSRAGSISANNAAGVRICLIGQYAKEVESA